MSDKVRVYEIAEEMGTSSSEVIIKAKDLRFNLKSPQSALNYQDAEELLNYIITGKSNRLKEIKIKKEIKINTLGNSSSEPKINPNKTKKKQNVTLKDIKNSFNKK